VKISRSDDVEGFFSGVSHQALQLAQKIHRLEPRVNLYGSLEGGLRHLEARCGVGDVGVAQLPVIDLELELYVLTERFGLI
jgi:hypothetical protein